MAIKTFTTGEVLTASDTNTYLANSGLVYVTHGALSNTTTNFVGCFTSAFTNYRIVLDNLGGSALVDFYFRMLQGSTAFTTAQYYWGGTGFTSAGANFTTNGGAQAQMYFGASSSIAGTSTASSTLDIYSPLPAVRTFFTSASVGVSGANYYIRNVGGAMDNFGVFDGIQIASISATTMTGNVTIYGVRKG
jgi:hypothetical protein